MIKYSIVSNAILLGLFALATALVLSTTNQLTSARIAEVKHRAAQQALLDLLPEQPYDGQLVLETSEIPPEFWPILGLSKDGVAYIARLGNRAVAAIIPSVSQQGYSGDISMLVGIDVDGSITGVRVTNHAETPGLGDKIELRKSNWILSFNHRSLQNTDTRQWAVRKQGGDFDQFTGATITPRAVINQVLATLNYLEQDHERLFASGKTYVSGDQP